MGAHPVPPGPLSGILAPVSAILQRTQQAFFAMRLTPQQIDIIRATVAEVGGADARVRLFGSRVDDNARGGDIDLLVETPHPVDDPATMIARLSARIRNAVGRTQGRRTAGCAQPATPSDSRSRQGGRGGVVNILLALKNTPFMARVFSPIAALQKLDVAPLCLRFCALLSTKIHAPRTGYS